MGRRPNHKFKLSWRFRFIAIFGIIVALLLISGGISLFLIEIEDVIYADGKIMSERHSDIVGHVDGRIIKLNFQEGDDVKQGDVIAVIDSILYEEEHVNANSALKELEAEREVKKVELAVLSRNPLPKELWYADTNLSECQQKAVKTSDRLERYKKLYKLNAISQKDFETTEIENIQAQAELARATENLRKVQSGIGDKYIEKANRDIDLVQARLDGRRAVRDLAAKHIAECKIIAPSAGRIVGMPCKSTMYVEKGKIAVMMATGSLLKGLAYVEEGVIRKVRPGQLVRISSGVFNRLEFGNFFGKVDRIYDVPIDDKTTNVQKYPVEIIIDVEGRTLKLGSSAEFAIITGREPVIYSILGITKEDFKSRRELEKLKVKSAPAIK
jgi:multidrug resistance efflux pump